MRKWKAVKRHPNIYEYQTKKGKRYGVRRIYKNSENKSQEFTRSGFRSVKDAEIKLTEFENELYNNRISPIEHANITVGEYFDKIADRNVQLKKWRPDTQQTQVGYFNTHLRPVFGNVALSDVSRSDYQRFIDNLVKNNYAKTTINTINSIMQLIMNQAETFDLINKNKLKNIAIIGAKSAKDLTLEDTDYKKWLDTAKKILNKYQLSMVYLFTLGPRREEILGLRLESFEFLKDKNGQELCKITIDRGRTEYKPNGGELKTSSSYRTLYITGEMIGIIKFAINTCKSIREKYNLDIKPDTFLFVNEMSGHAVHITYPSRVFTKVSKACGVHIHPHKLRHYFATRAKESNLSDTSIAKWLGHSNVQMTNQYTRPNKSSVIKVYNGVKQELGF